MGKKRKYLSEFGVNIVSSGWMMMTSDQLRAEGEMLEEQEALSKECHIYLICKRPASYFIKDTFSYCDERISVEVGYKVDGVQSVFSYEGKFPLLDDAVDVRVSDYPHREIITYSSDGKVVRKLPANIISSGQGHELILKNLEVLYVGQSFGNGSRTAIDRLKSHSTLQKVLADSSYNYPDSEISVLMFKFEPYRLLMNFDGMSEGTISDERDEKRFVSIKNNPLRKKQQIGLVEAALIRYFEPDYNDKFKIKFPSPKTKLLKKCYELDFSGLCVEINTEELGFSLFSKRRAAAAHHIANIDIVDDQSRASFFYVAGGGKGLVKVSDVIGVSKS